MVSCARAILWRFFSKSEWKIFEFFFQMYGLKNKLLPFPGRKYDSPHFVIWGKNPKVGRHQPSRRHDDSKLYWGTTRCEELQSRPISSQLACSEAGKDPQNTGIAASVGALWADRESSAQAVGPFMWSAAQDWIERRTGKEAMSVGVASDPHGCKNWTRTIILPARPNWSIRWV